MCRKQQALPLNPYLVFGQRSLARGMRSSLERAMCITTGPRLKKVHVASRLQARSESKPQHY